MGTNFFTTKMMIDLLLIILGITIVAVFIVYIQKQFYRLIDSICDIFVGNKYKRIDDLKETDRMSGRQFEKWLEVKFKQLGYDVILTPISKDRGADLIITNNSKGHKIAVQAKKLRTGGRVGVKVIGEALRAYHNYDCKQKMIITNQYFTEQAKEEAINCNVTLIDRDELNKLIDGIKSESTRSEIAATKQTINKQSRPVNKSFKRT